MKAKTTKFLAVLAVLAMAFAGVAVLAQDQNVADAAVDGATERAEGHNVSLKIGETTTYYTTAAKAFAAVNSNDKATITLLASHIGEGLKTGSGVTKSNVTIDFAGFTYTVNQGVGSSGTETAGAQLLKDNTYIFKNGTMDVAPMEGVQKKRSNVINNYSDLTLTDMVIDGTNLKAGFNWCTDPTSSQEEGGMTVAVWLSNGVVKINGSTTIIKGTHGAKNFGLGADSWSNYNDGAHVEVDTTGEIDGILMAKWGGAATASTMVIKNANIYGNVYTYDGMTEGLFEIKGATVPAGKTLTNNGVLYLAKGDVLTVNGTLVNNGTINNSGTLNGTGVVEVKKGGVLSAPADATFGIAGTLDLKIVEGAQVSKDVKIGFVDQYNDTHSFKTDKELTVQMGGFDIKAGENCIVVSGTALMTGVTNFEFTGNALLTGTIYTVAPGTATTTNTLSIKNTQGVDVKVEKFQIAGPGAVTLLSSVFVVPNSTFNVSGTLKIEAPAAAANEIQSVAVLKVADGAVVKSAGLITTTKDKGSIWNAGSVYAPATQEYADGQLVRVFMNNVAGTGLFYKGSVVYNGSDTEGTFVPLAVAYGAYLDITGICDVNITSGQTSVVNPLYKYFTMTIATDDSNIALNVDYDNYYTPEIDLLKKAPASKEKSGKYVTFRGVNWNTADSAILQIIAPEVYDVKLVATITKGANAADPTLADPITSGITFTDQNERVITPNAEGIVSLVFGYEYTIEGANSDSKYKFIDYFELFDTLDPVDKTKATFTMVRGPTVKAIIGGAEAAVLPYGVLQITEGFASKITVTVDPAEKMTEGQVFLYYKVEKDGQEMPVAYSKDAAKMVITGIYSNDNLYFKTVDIDFYKYQFGEVPVHTDADDQATPAVAETKGWQVVPALSTTDAKTIPTDGWTAVAGVVGNDGKIGTDGKGGVALPIVIVEDSIELVASVVLGDADSKVTSQSFTISWVNVQKTPVTVSSSDKFIDEDDEETSGKLVKLLADEIITITWEDIDDVRQSMTILGKDYTKGTEYTVSTKVAATTEKTMVLELDKIEYAKVKNSSTKDFTVTDGNFTNAVAKTKTVDKAVEAFNANVTGNNLKPTLVTLVIEGQSVVSWTYTLWDAQATPVKVPNYIEKNVVGETAAIPLVDGYTIEVTALNTIYNQYIVKTQPVDHVQIGDYSRVGHMNDNMFVYYSVDDKYTLKGVEVYYEDPENEGFPDIERGVYANAEPKTAADGQKYWAYKMPASNVYLKPIVDSDYAIITYKNYDGTVLQTGEVKKGTMPEYTGATPVKPATATETYRFAGWEPEVVAVTADATYTATFETVAPTSTDVTIFLEKAQGGVRVTLLSNDGRFIQDGSVEFTYTYAYELNGKWATGFKTCTAQTGEIGDKTLFQFTVDLSEKERFSETMWILGAYTSADKAVNAVSELIVYQ